MFRVKSGPGGNIIHKWWTGTTWKEMNLDGETWAMPSSAVSARPSRIDLFYRGRNDRIWQKKLIQSGTDWSEVDTPLGEPQIDNYPIAIARVIPGIIHILQT